MHSQTHKEVVKSPWAKSKEKIESQICQPMLALWQPEGIRALSLVIQRNLMNIMGQKIRYWDCLSWRVGLANPLLTDIYIKPGYIKHMTSVKE